MSFVTILASLPEFGTMSDEIRDVFKHFAGSHFDYTSDITLEEAKHKQVEWERVEEVRDAAKVLTSAVNSMGVDVAEVAKAFFVGLATEHRTLQSQAVLVLLEVLKLYCDVGYDLRNKAAVAAARRVAQVLKEESVYFPFI